jgi:hypothetical protein
MRAVAEGEEGGLNRHLAAWFLPERDGTDETIMQDITATKLDPACF